MWKVETMVGKCENIKVAAKVELGLVKIPYPSNTSFGKPS